MEVGVITNIVTSYREGFYDRLFSRKDINVTVYSGDNIPGTQLKSIHDKYDGRIKIVNTWIAKGEKIGFQFLPFKKIFSEYDVIFLDGNPRILSNLIMGFVSFFSKKKIVMWTMAHSFGANKLTESIRLKWTSLYKNIFVYTDLEVEMLRKKGWMNKNIIGMNNGLDQKLIDKEISRWDSNKLGFWKEEKHLTECVIMLSIARLVPKNKFELIIEALPHIISKIPNIKWVVIGAGSEELLLKNLAREKGLLDFILFEGPIYEETLLAPYFLSASIFVHPSSIGLSIMHAFGYGLPVVVDGERFMHGPEYGAFVDKQTGLNFRKDDVLDLSNKILQLLESPTEFVRMSEVTRKIARERYNVDIMVERFIQMCKGCK